MWITVPESHACGLTGCGNSSRARKPEGRRTGTSILCSRCPHPTSPTGITTTPTTPRDISTTPTTPTGISIVPVCRKLSLPSHFTNRHLLGILSRPKLSLSRQLSPQISTLPISSRAFLIHPQASIPLPIHTLTSLSLTLRQ
jgi:hypothetical protein